MMRSIFLLGSIIIFVHSTCPDGCKCSGFDISCKSLSSTELPQFLVSLSSNNFSQCESLEIVSTSNFTINMLPSLKNLRTLIIDGCPNMEEWELERGKFPNVTKLQYTNSKLKIFSRLLMTAFPKLVELDLSHNELETLGVDSIHFAKLETMIIRNNNIWGLGLHVLRYMPALRVLDFTNNKMFRLVTSDFFSVTALRILRLGGNKIRTIECDTSTSLPQIEELDLSQNVLTHIPGDGIKNMEQINFLNISGNPISVVAEGSLRLPNLQILDLSQCNLTVVEAGAFSYLPYLHTLYLNDNPHLIFISPYSVRNVTSIFSLDIRNTGFYRIPLYILNQVSRIYTANVRLDCGCALKYMTEIGTITIMDWSKATCATKSGAVHKLSELNKAMLTTKDECREKLLLPFGDEQSAVVGDSYRIHCATDNMNSKMTWQTPDGVISPAVSPELTSGMKKLDYFTTSLFDPATAARRQNRTHVTTEYFGIDVVLPKDAGKYECISKYDQTNSRKIQLTVFYPDIYLNASHVSVTSVHLTWNKNLQIKAVDRVALQVTAESGTEFKRQVQLSLYNMFCSYNLINLTPDKEYHICLQWVMTDDNSIIYSTCINQKTNPVKSFMNSVSLEFIIIGGIVVCAIGFFCCGNCVQQRFSFLANAKRESKMQQSVSGQSMLSSSSGDAITYENFQLNTSPSFSNA